MEKEKIIIVVGPTASGKTDLAITLAQEFTGEVISADSRQIYRGLDIGTAKVTTAEMRGVPHHLINIVDIHENYGPVDFKRDAATAITNITSRDALPIIAGGTFFYTDTLLGRISTPAVPPNPALREALEELPVEALYTKLQKIDPRRAADIDEHNPRRLVRAIEIASALGAVPEKKPLENLYDALIIGIETDRDELRARIAARAPAWLTIGLKEEVVALLTAGVSKERLNEMGFEYQIGMELAAGAITEEAFIQKFTEKNWQYAKRQLSWLKRDQTIEWYKREHTHDVIARVREFLG